jgi:hypothetical protein
VAPLAAACVFLGVAVPIALYDERLTAAALLVIFGAGATAFVRAGRSEVASTAGAVLAAALAGSVWTWGAITGAAEPWTALAGLVVLSAAALGVWALPGGWWATDDAGFARNGLEVGAAASALPLGLAGVLAAGVSAGSTGPTWTAVYLTVAGVAVCVRALLVGDRQPLGWVGGGLLALASWVRLADLGVHQPEAYTLPAACALLVVGCVHLRRHVGSSTMAALAPGLGLALAPSLLWVLWEPATLRALLLGLGCLALLAVGLRMRWSAPVVFAATVGGLLVLRLAAPYIGEAVPRWVLIGAAGAVLVGAGVTWERRLGEARQLIGYVRDLR